MQVQTKPCQQQRRPDPIASSLTPLSLDTVRMNPVMSPELGTGYAQLAVTTEVQRRPCVSHGVMIGFPTAPGPSGRVIDNQR